MSKRLHNKPWKNIYGTDRKYTARVDRAIARGQYTASKKASVGSGIPVEEGS